MKTYTTEELKEILNLHKKWLNDDENGVNANLTGANLTGADLIEGQTLDWQTLIKDIL